jgi:hypothetical protein
MRFVLNMEKFSDKIKEIDSKKFLIFEMTRESCRIRNVMVTTFICLLKVHIVEYS